MKERGLWFRSNATIGHYNNYDNQRVPYKDQELYNRRKDNDSDIDENSPYGDNDGGIRRIMSIDSGTNSSLAEFVDMQVR